MSKKVYKICVAVIIFTIVLDLILLVKDFSISNIAGLLISFLLLTFFYWQRKKGEW
ncbi:hypothetical protein [Clostridioides difficile]|uniref:hypothetical protein n=1 Tax=Clostridioides difficile TaxID=1496 RepID=UPI0020C4FD1C|nr:hypothetical protein [Clostridioides difficile]MCP8383902.1 hypothetical protein [Clostridioides difficile]MCP8665477.1 hypothetical protein [Clostridioides difficile]